ncbi:MAG: (2Fe-2S)-binding protein [Kofleriaceae bacterium]|nr:(2Fe-2S)-binding protein [Kofleriaceae bacterium]
MIVCLCHPASDRDVDACIRQGARSVDDIGRMCGAGTGCGACRDDLRIRLEHAGCDGEPDGEAGAAGIGAGAGAGCAPGLVSLGSRTS